MYLSASTKEQIHSSDELDVTHKTEDPYTGQTTCGSKLDKKDVLDTNQNAGNSFNKVSWQAIQCSPQKIF